MFKKFYLLMIVIFILLLPTSLATENITILVNNSKIYSDVAPFITNGTTYVPLRFISEALDTDNIVWNQNNQSVTIKKKNNTLTFFINKNYAFINNTRKTINGTPIIKDNRTFVPLRIISENLDATVSWNEDTKTISITTQNNSTTTNKPSNSVSSNNNNNISNNSNSISSNKPSSNSSNTSPSISKHDEDAVYWLSRIIEAEAGGEPYSGKVAVGEVILNRVESNDFPNTIWKVIFDDNFGIQFEPVANGTIYNTPSTDSIKAAKEALNGSNYAKNSLYFLNPTIASSNWITKNREYCMTIANHDFYL